MPYCAPQYTGTLYLLNDVEGKLQSLSLQYGDEVLEEDWEMFMAVSEWNQDGHLQHKYYDITIRSHINTFQNPCGFCLFSAEKKQFYIN